MNRKRYPRGDAKRFPEYKVWAGMRQRCNNPNAHGYHNYGGRGIKCCARWETFWNFYDDMGPRPSKHYTLDRIDNDGDYTPENCRWATWRQQHNNRRDNVILTIDGVEKTMAQWARESGRIAEVIYQRLNRGWSPRDAVFKEPEYTPPTDTGYYTIDGETKTLLEWSKESGIKKGTLRMRIRRGWDIKSAVFYPVQKRSE